MSVTAESLPNKQAMLASEVPGEQNRRRLNAALIGAVATSSEVYLETEIEKPINSLYEGIKLAKSGDPEGVRMVTTAAEADVSERTLKVGHVLKPREIELSPSGLPYQNRQSYLIVQANSLKINSGNEVMASRTEAESLNGYLMADMNRLGLFDQGYSMVTFSLAENLPEYGFFTETMSCSIQVTSKADNKLVVESAFVAGKKAEFEPLQDFNTVKKIYEYLVGVDISNMSNAEIIALPLIIHKSVMPNGVIDLVKLYDQFADGTFFGQAKPQSDYSKYLEHCRQVEAGFSKTVDEIVKDLLDESDSINSPLEAIRRLNKISGSHMAERAVFDGNINPTVFGAEAAVHINNARIALSQNDWQTLSKEIAEAKKTETSSSCPTMLGGGESSSGDNDEFGSLNFSCPKCGFSNKRPRGGLIKNCQHCSADVSCGKPKQTKSSERVKYSYGSDPKKEKANKADNGRKTGLLALSFLR